MRKERERERESFSSFQSIIAFLLSRFMLLLFAGALSSFIGRGIDFVSLFASLFVSPSIIGGELTRVNFSFLNTKRKDR